MQTLQNMLFQQIRQQCKDQSAMIEQISELLSIRKDSVYRRVKGETPLQYDEVITLAERFGLSLDDLFFADEKTVMFKGRYMHETQFGLHAMLSEMEWQLNHAAKLHDVSLTYVSKDIPVFYYFMFPQVAAFKVFVWLKSQFQFEEWKSQPFTFSILTPTLQKQTIDVSTAYIKIPSIEILNADNILNDVRQLEQYWETGVIKSRDDLEKIYISMHEMVDHMEAQASAGYKFSPDTQEPAAKLQLFVNDFFVGDNTVLISNQDINMVFLNHTAVNFMSTTNQFFVNYNRAFIHNLIRKSTLISEVGERVRSRFFHLIHELIRISMQLTLGANGITLNP